MDAFQADGSNDIRRLQPKTRSVTSLIMLGVSEKQPLMAFGAWSDLTRLVVSLQGRSTNLESLCRGVPL